MQITIDISPLAEKYLGTKNALEAAIEHEAKRLWHIDRSKPKSLSPHRPSGPSPADELTRIYSARREQLGEETFTRLLGTQFEKLNAAINSNNTEVIEWFKSTQPWVLHGSPQTKPNPKASNHGEG